MKFLTNKVERGPKRPLKHVVIPSENEKHTINRRNLIEDAIIQ